MSPIFTAIDKQANIFAMKWSSYTRNIFTVTIFGNNIGVFGNIDLFALNKIGKETFEILKKVLYHIQYKKVYIIYSTYDTISSMLLTT